MRASMASTSASSAGQMHARHADGGVGFVDRAVGRDAQSVLGTRSPVPSAVVPSSPVRV